MNIIHYLQKNPFVLAPMAGITDCSFRSFMREMGAGVVVTELVSAAGLDHKSLRTRQLMRFSDEQHPVGVQIFGEDPQQMAEAARIVEGEGADFVDVNFGCPVPKVVKKGAGSAMLKDLAAMRTVLSSMVKSVKIPVTIKIRTGWDANSRNADQVVQLAYEEGITWVAIHGRTRAQGYAGFADWDYIGQIKRTAKLPILGNGDILTAQMAVQRIQNYGLDGVLIGRGCLKNPYIFNQSTAIWSELLRKSTDKELVDPPRPYFHGRGNYGAVFGRLSEILLSQCDDRISQIQLKKFAAWFATGYPGAANFRKSVFQSQSTSEVLKTAMDFFSQLNILEQQDTSHEAFLMGGHG
jgi:tRNA-dihydrouridine synthase B